MKIYHEAWRDRDNDFDIDNCISVVEIAMELFESMEDLEGYELDRRNEK